MKAGLPDRDAFTLLELLVVLALVGVIAGVVAASFNGGIKVWETARNLTDIEQEVYFAAEYMKRDVASTFTFDGIGFSGHRADMGFPAIVDAGGGDGACIGTVKYVFNQGAGTISRLQWRYPASAESAQAEVVAGGVKSISCQYLDPLSGDDSGEWKSEWTSVSNYPAAVRVRAVFEKRGQEVELDRYILLAEGLWRQEN